MEPYTKPPLSYPDQISRLKVRGLTIQFENEAIQFLQQVSYYRFSAYSLPFQNPRDVFIAGATFEIIEELYRLDEQLRNDLLALLSPIEIFLRTRVTYELSHGWGPFAHYNKALFRRSFDHDQWTASLEVEVSRAKERFIEHYKAKYSGFPHLPLWMASEIMSLGSLSLLYSGLLPDPQRRICSIFKVHHEVLKNWIHVFTYLRNTCAHHGRLWNREFAIRPEIPHKDRQWTSLNLNNSYLFANVAVLEWMCSKSGLPVAFLENVHETMRAIAALDGRFMGMMRVPVGRMIGMCWEGEK